MSGGSDWDDLQPPGGAWRPEPQEPSTEASGPRILAHDSAGRGNIVGIVRNIQTRQDINLTGRPDTVWNFRLERFDHNGNRLPPIPVEMRGRTMTGALSEGDWIRVPGTWKKGTTLVVRRVQDLSTDTEVGAKATGCLLLTLALIGVATMVIFAAMWLVGAVLAST
jgi:hypothetical protein